MLIEKSACNKPLTLDCQVSSNPSANITWYRRRLSRAYFNKLFPDERQTYTGQKRSFHKKRESGFSYFSLFDASSHKGKKTANVDSALDPNEMFEDEPIGSGQSYTIASFNCANVLENVRNKTKPPNDGLKKSQINRLRFKSASRLVMLPKLQSTKKTPYRDADSTTPLFNSKIKTMRNKRDAGKHLLRQNSKPRENSAQVNYSLEDIEYNDDDSLPMKPVQSSTTGRSASSEYLEASNQDQVLPMVYNIFF
jgi:hypothetical protein